MTISEDHRTRVAAVRREKMRGRLLDSALHIISANGLAALSIDRLIAHAEVSRGTFYKYYDAPNTLVRELALGISNELILHAEPLVLKLVDPAARIATGVRALMYICAAQPVLGHFLVHLGWSDINQQHQMFNFVKRDVDEGQRLQRFLPMAPDLALCLVGISAIAGIQVMLLSPNPRGIPEQTAAAVLRALGMKNEDAEPIAQRALPQHRLPKSGLIHRATSLAQLRDPPSMEKA